MSGNSLPHARNKSSWLLPARRVGLFRLMVSVLGLKCKRAFLIVIASRTTLAAIKMDPSDTDRFVHGGNERFSMVNRGHLSSFVCGQVFQRFSKEETKEKEKILGCDYDSLVVDVTRPKKNADSSLCVNEEIARQRRRFLTHFLRHSSGVAPLESEEGRSRARSVLRPLEA